MHGSRGQVGLTAPNVIMEESYQNENLGLDVGPSPFLRAASHDVLPRSTSNDPTPSESPAPSNSGELAKRRVHGHKRASSLSDLSRCSFEPSFILPCRRLMQLDQRLPATDGYGSA